MPSSYDPNGSTAKDQVRLLISDVGGDSGSDWIFADEEIATYLSMRGGSVFRAAATALRTISSNEAMVSKVITFLDIQTNGEAVADALRKGAAELEATADEGADSDFDLAFAEVDLFSSRRLRGVQLW